MSEPRVVRASRVLVIGLLLSIAVAGAGGLYELVRFGTNPQAAAARLERDVRTRFRADAHHVNVLTSVVAADPALIRDADTRPDRLPDLFARLAELVDVPDAERVSVTVYVPVPARDRFRVLAWSEGPAEDLVPERLNGPAALFVAPGTVGLRLVSVLPIDEDGRRVAVVAAEAILSPLALPGAAGATLESAFGPVTAVTPYEGAGEAPMPDGAFLIADETTGAPVLEVRYDPAQLESQRRRLRRRTLALAGVPLVLGGLLWAVPLVGRRSRAGGPRAWLLQSAVVAAVLIGAGLGAAGLLLLAGIGGPAPLVAAGAVALGLAALVSGDLWWRAAPRRHPALSPRFVVEHLAAGGIVLVTVSLLASLLQGRVSAAALGTWQFPLLPFDPTALLHLVSLFLLSIALCWTAAGFLGALSVRWHLSHRRPVPALTAAVLWLGPAAAAAALPASPVEVPGWTASAAALALVAFGLGATGWRRHYRHTTQTMRLFLLFLALTMPVIVTYPMIAAAADRAARDLIERQFAPALAEHPQRLEADLAQAQREIDAIRELPELIATADAAGDATQTGTAFTIWRRTSLATSRVTAELEVFGGDRRLLSRFALNVSEYSYGEEVPVWTGSGCAWQIFGEVRRLGATERDVLHGERGVCSPDGRLLGAVVVHLLPDYESLPFVPSSTSTYANALRDRGNALGSTRLAGLEVTVYGWSFTPLFTSGGVAWTITPELADRFTRSREAFWSRRTAAQGDFDVYFANNRNGIYALGFPAPTALEHATRLAEATAVTASLLLLALIGATLVAPLTTGRRTPIPVVLHEVRTSFYRKLFLLFVLAAVGPIVTLAFAFGAYTAAQVRADVEREAGSLVTLTRRLFEEGVATQQHPDQPQPIPTDDLMVSLRQVIHQDVNLFVGPRMVATSQRDLFDSGLVPGRTPAAVYRSVALDRQPTYVGEEQLGSFRYLVAAAPVFPALGQDMLVSVPLATRQREIEHQIDELNRRVLVAAVVVIFLAAGLGAQIASRVSDPVERLSRAARQIAAGRLEVRIVADTADELRRLVDDFNAMASTLVAQRAELERTNQLKAWAQMARQVAHEIKNPLTPIQLAAEHLQRVHEDRQRPLGAVFDSCLDTILGQVRLLRRISSEFANFATEPTPRPAAVDVAALLESVVRAYRASLAGRVAFAVRVAADTPPAWIDRTLVARAFTNLVENAIQAMPDGGQLRIAAGPAGDGIEVTVSDDGIGMDAEEIGQAFEPSFSTKTAGSGLGLPNARRNVERCGGAMRLDSEPGRGTTVTVTLPAAPRDGDADA